jgi:hypothetical protein
VALCRELGLSPCYLRAMDHSSAVSSQTPDFLRSSVRAPRGRDAPASGFASVEMETPLRRANAVTDMSAQLLTAGLNSISCTQIAFDIVIAGSPR